MIFLYNFFISLYHLALRLAALRNKKARQWVEGRKNLLDRLQEELSNEKNIIWMHCSSAGEFEQGKPVLEALKESYPHYKILVTFFSPSGFEAAKKYKVADFKTYLPLDTATNAAKFLSVVKPKLVVFVKYDYWYHHLKAVKQHHIPLIIISAIYRKNSIFFKAYGGFYRKMLRLFTWIFVQNDDSKKLLNNIHITACSVAGDTRFDRVAAIASNFTALPLIEKFIGNEKVLIAGSTWPDDETLLAGVIKTQKLKLIIAPHEINKAHIEKLFSLFPNALPYSAANDVEDVAAYPVLIIDNVGMLSRLYHYATITYIGGGFNKSGIHNTLEAAVWGKPVLFGPNYQKFKEAKELIDMKGGFSINKSEDLIEKISQLLTDDSLLQQSSLAAKEYVQVNKGATQIILAYIQENRLLTKL